MAANWKTKAPRVEEGDYGLCAWLGDNPVRIVFYDGEDDDNAKKRIIYQGTPCFGPYNIVPARQLVPLAHVPAGTTLQISAELFGRVLDQQTGGYLIAGPDPNEATPDEQ